MNDGMVSYENFNNARPWWRTHIFTEIVTCRDGVGDLRKLLRERASRPFFIIDEILKPQRAFAPIFACEGKYVFDASYSEPRTRDVDRVVALLKNERGIPDAIVGVGGGASMDLAKAVSICLANPRPSAEYQGYGMDMERGPDIWVLPTLAGTGAEVTPIAVLRGPEKKLGINNDNVAPKVAVIDPALSAGAKKFNRFFSMMDCYFHHYEITHSKTSAPDAVLDSRDGVEIARSVLSQDLSEFDIDRAVDSAVASVLGGSSSIGGRVGVSHAISYGLSNASPHLPHSVAVAISMLACGDIYSDGGFDDTVKFLEINGLARPTGREYGIFESHIPGMTRTALGMEKLWLSHFGENWRDTVDEKFISDIYKRIVSA
ncbi:MAG: iron-containing alcohol dehydrogenase [Synergistaceae bacterium]|jgi:3-deoxy-alpha-D-manno-octulosonate 8-oxidase|nr:iron-containing alcohol dehydrogenase [Synergistaceae bacterium]